MKLIIPEDYKQTMVPETTEQAIQLLKATFQEKLSKALNLRRVTAPLFVLSGTGINDDLNGVERAVKFPVRCMNDRQVEVVHSLAKWKRMKLGSYRIPAGYGLYTDMNAIRPDEDLDNLHSLYVDQWDWEQTIREQDRNLDYLRKVVRSFTLFSRRSRRSFTTVIRTSLRVCRRTSPSSTLKSFFRCIPIVIRAKGRRKQPRNSVPSSSSASVISFRRQETRRTCS
jgi:hypothetical protein